MGLKFTALLEIFFRIPLSSVDGTSKVIHLKCEDDWEIFLNTKCPSVLMLYQHNLLHKLFVYLCKTRKHSRTDLAVTSMNSDRVAMRSIVNRMSDRHL